MDKHATYNINPHENIFIFYDSNYRKTFTENGSARFCIPGIKKMRLH